MRKSKTTSIQGSVANGRTRHESVATHFQGTSWDSGHSVGIGGRSTSGRGATPGRQEEKESGLIYTYGWSPFSSEAVQLLESTGYDFVQKELGAEWFLLGGQESNWPRRWNRVPRVSPRSLLAAHALVDVGNWDNWRNPVTWRLSFAKHGYPKRRRRRPRKQSKIDGSRRNTDVYIVKAAVSKLLLGVFTSIDIPSFVAIRFYTNYTATG